MCVSEILSMEVGAVEFHPIGETGIQQAYIVARLFKTVDQHGGRLERWIAPEPVVNTVSLLEQLSATLREVSGRCELFLVKNTQYGEIVPVTQMHIGWRINDFARPVRVPMHDGKPWAFSSHQFRKTFARFIDALVDAERRIETQIAERLGPGARERLDGLLTEVLDSNISHFILWAGHGHDSGVVYVGRRVHDNYAPVRSYCRCERRGFDLPRSVWNHPARHGTAFLTEGSRRIPAAQAALIGSLDIPFAILLVWLALSEVHESTRNSSLSCVCPCSAPGHRRGLQDHRASLEQWPG